MQLALLFENLPQPNNQLWHQLDERLRRDAIETLARLIAQTARTLPSDPEASDE
jgi:hypothetical protein